MSLNQRAEAKIEVVRTNLDNCILQYYTNLENAESESYKKELYDAFNKEWKIYANKVQALNKDIFVDVFSFEKSVKLINESKLN